MGFLRTAVTLVAAGVAANMVLKARREGMASRGESGGGLLGSLFGVSGASRASGSGGSGDLVGGSGRYGSSGMSGGTGSSEGAGMSSVPGVTSGSSSSGGQGLGSSASGADSLNAGERLQSQGVGASSYAGGGDSDNLFGPNSQEGSTPRTPGLSDFSRGA